MVVVSPVSHSFDLLYHLLSPDRRTWNLLPSASPQADQVFEAYQPRRVGALRIGRRRSHRGRCARYGVRLRNSIAGGQGSGMGRRRMLWRALRIAYALVVGCNTTVVIFLQLHKHVPHVVCGGPCHCD